MIQVVNRALDILEMISKNQDRNIGLFEISNAVGLNPATCANILKTLLNRGYVEKNVVTKGYKLGYMSYKIINSNSYYHELNNIAAGIIDDLRDEFDETVILSIIKSNKRFLLYKAECLRELQVKTFQEAPVYKATTGRMILSHYSPKELRDFIDKVGLPADDEWPEIKSETDLIASLDKIRTSDILISINANHVVGLATPIYKNGTIIASLGVFLPDIRFDKDVKTNLINRLKAVTNIINSKLDVL